MHIPDGFLDTKAWVSTAVLGAGALNYALTKTKATITKESVPKLAIVGSFIFAAQMINFPIAGATSGHFSGGALAAILFGPLIGMMVMSAVLLIQAFIFQDGGVAALGANIVCTGLVGCMVGYAIHSLGSRRFSGFKAIGRGSNAMLQGSGPSFILSFVASWCSLVCAAASVALLLAWSGTVPLGSAMSAMIGWHAWIGIGEGLITALVLAYLTERRVQLTPGVVA